MQSLAKTLIVIGLILAGVGFFLAALGKIPGMGKIPGDFYYRKGNFMFYFPLATSLLISLLLTLLMNLFWRR